MIQSRSWKPSKASAIETSEVLTIVDSSVDRKRATHSLFKKLFLVYRKENTPLGLEFFLHVVVKRHSKMVFYSDGKCKPTQLSTYAVSSLLCA
jgi:hypothetical protein